MKAVIYAVLAVVLYAATNLVLEERLSKYNNVAILLCSYPIMLTLALSWAGGMKASGQQISFPVGTILLIASINAIAWFAADYFFVGAYTNAGSLMMVTTIVMMFPVVTSLMKFVLTRELPNGYQIAAWGLGATAVWLLTKGESVKVISQQP